MLSTRRYKMKLETLTLIAGLFFLCTMYVQAETVYTPDGTYTCTVYDDGTRICF